MRANGPLSPGGTAAALVTHLHSDHADPVAIRKALAPGAPVYRPGTGHRTGRRPQMDL
ncbi:hypothetical protein [Streptomyces rimosus]|uniref:hypothetical protein n=1 Tax=Streptomyces rimosus TaxID=1927 RepID=UPI000A477181|nr:hypothetical protein [Streptomyces rimosus]